MIIYQGKRLKVTKAVGFRLGCAYLPNWRSNPDTDQPISLMVWTGPYIFVWAVKKRGWVPRELDDDARIQSLLEARHRLNHEIDDAFRYRWRKKTEAERRKMHEVHPDVRRQWQAESDAVRLREMEDAERDSQD